MFSERNNLLEWNLDFLLNNLGFQLEQPIYEKTKYNIIIFSSAHIPKGHKQNIYYFIANNWCIEIENSSSFCYFCEFISFTGNRIQSPCKNNDHFLCSDCVIEWNIFKDKIYNYNDNLFIINDAKINRITVNAIYIKEYYSILYEIAITPINKFTYTSKYIKDDEDYCDLCYSSMDFNDFNHYTSPLMSTPTTIFLPELDPDSNFIAICLLRAIEKATENVLLR